MIVPGSGFIINYTVLPTVSPFDIMQHQFVSLVEQTDDYLKADVLSESLFINFTAQGSEYLTASTHGYDQQYIPVVPTSGADFMKTIVFEQYFTGSI